jgi:8-oxo-dGTP pyrophosphatase MutT (NUDIX family)
MTAHDRALTAVTRSALAERLANANRFVRTHAHDRWHQHTITPDETLKHAAVLVPLVDRPEGVHVLLTQRTAHLNGHAGQISFPGGGVEPADKHRQDTALRETEEEIGLQRRHIDVLGELPYFEMRGGFCVTPVVGWVRPPYAVTADPFEVQDIFEIPLAHFLDPRNYQRRSYLRDGQEHRYLAAPYQGRYVWGATCGMLYLFYQLIRG